MTRLVFVAFTCIFSQASNLEQYQAAGIHAFLTHAATKANEAIGSFCGHMRLMLHGLLNPQNPQECMLIIASRDKCPEDIVLMRLQVSERSIVQVFERCHELEIVNIVPATWSAVQDMLLWQTVWMPDFCMLIRVSA